MKFTRLLAVFCFAFCTFVLALPVRAEMAGQVLDAVGDVFALRTSQIVRLNPGAAIESGDQVHTGPESHVQIRFTDWGMISLRSNSDFVVDEYSYETRKGGHQRAFFSLLKGGIRSLTGMIGHSNRKNFSLRVATATVGIRGTHFTVLMCQGECRNSDGSVALDGLYGEIMEGRIAVSPYGGNDLEREFGAGEFFHLMNENSVPAPLFSLPPFFRDKLDDQARSAGSAVAGIAP
ncbi:MAG TPA: FecR family protein, partial [Burkholderiales bacterium]|nr:FecR family protein [Burkholderiales bacterium]